MESYLSIFQGILSTEGTFLDIYLDGLEDHRKFSIQSNEGAEIVQNITSLLTKSTSRSLGLRLLTKYVDLCPIEVLEKKGNLWITLVLKAFNSQELKCDALLMFEVLGKIIKRSIHSTDLAKSFASTHISKVYENLTKVSQFQVKYALSCIETCLRTYPGSSGPSKGLLERFLWKNVDHLDGEVVQNCGKCLHLLQQVKGGGVQGVNHKTQWKNYQLQLIGGIHSVYNEMFSNCAEIYEEKIEQVKFPWEAEQHKFDAEPVRKAAQMYSRCHNMIKYLIIALSEPFPVEKPILVRKVLNVVVRGLSVNCLMLEQNPIADNIALSILLPKIHVDLFELLKVAVLILRGHVRPYSELILGLIIDALKWTSTKSSHSEQKTLLVLRKQVYETASLWCKILNSGNRCETVAEYLFQEIFSDITPTQSEFTLKVCYIMMHTSISQICAILYELSPKSTSLYNNKDCRIEIYNTLYTILLTPHYLCPPPTDMAFTIIQTAYARDDSLKVRNRCYFILQNLEKIIHPQKESLLFTIDARDIRNTFIKMGQESLLQEFRYDFNNSSNKGSDVLEFNYATISKNLNTPINNHVDDDNVHDDNVHDDNVQYDNAQYDLGYKNKSQTNVDIISTNTEILQNHNLNEDDPLKDQTNEDIELEFTMDQVNSKDSLPNAINTSIRNVENISKSQDVLIINEDTNIAALCIEESNCDLISDEPNSKKQKLDNENEDKIELETVQTEISNIFSIEGNEDDLLADIASQFVDELN
ncbi:uncharacterized protein LOC111684110 [Lucilia cuprina]|uniref:uncharacterized protein LOC111684110 n=1 Tax=Lucilia cuprina TaxID=7375 RepID=UPI001F06FC46|nr:uncharacterized protein LOC111684110 [Lucilia cuprina]